MHKHTEKELIKGCKQYNRQIQEEVYNRYSSVLRAVCSRYAKDFSETEDILQEGFVKIFTHIKTFSYQGEGSFVFWMKKVVVNAAITFYNKHSKKRKELSIEDSPVDVDKNDNLSATQNEYEDGMYNSSKLTQEQIIKVLQSVPEDFRVVFNLYVMEGYSHKEIADMLEVKTETSRTRLLRAKNIIRRELLLIDKNLAK